MTSFVQFIFIVQVFVIIVDTTYQYASYSKTRVIITNCDPSTQISSVVLRKRIICSQVCTKNSDCRRYLYCTSDLSCKLYKDGNDCMMTGDAATCSCYKKNIGCINSVCTCPWGYHGSNCEHIITDCNHGTRIGITSANDVLAYIKPALSPAPIEVLCTFGYGGWTIIYHRSNICDGGQFNRTITEYEQGFGDNVIMNGWLGFEKILYILGGPNNLKTLAVLLYKVDTSYCINYYQQFSLGSRAESYKFHSSTCSLVYPSGGCGNSLTGNLSLEGKTFSTYDIDYSGSYDCANRFGAGWWYSDTVSDCTSSLLTGTVDGSGTDNFWDETLGSSALPTIMLKIQ